MSPVRFGDYTPELVIFDEGPDLIVRAGLLSSATVLTLEEVYGPAVGAYAGSDGMITLLIKSPYIDLDVLVNSQENNEP